MFLFLPRKITFFSPIYRWLCFLPRGFCPGGRLQIYMYIRVCAHTYVYTHIYGRLLILTGFLILVLGSVWRFSDGLSPDGRELRMPGDVCRPSSSCINTDCYRPASTRMSRCRLRQVSMSHTSLRYLSYPLYARKAEHIRRQAYKGTSQSGFSGTSPRSTGV